MRGFKREASCDFHLLDAEINKIRKFKRVSCVYFNR